MGKKYLVPFSEGNLLPSSRNIEVYRWKVVEWRDNIPFPAALELKTLPWGAADTTCEWRDVATGSVYPMFFTQLAEAIKAGAGIKNGVIRGVWDVRKIGNSFGVRLLAPEKAQEPQVITIPHAPAAPQSYVWYGTIGGLIEDEDFCHGCYTAACPGCRGHIVKEKE